jgi:hypothetical protein
MITIEEQREQFNKIMLGLEIVQKKLIEFKKQKNSVLVVIEDKKIVKLNPHELKLP